MNSRLPFPLLLCCAVLVSAAPKFPVHSWDTFPVFFHGSQQQTAADGTLDKAALDIVTKFPAVTLEKWQGDEAPRFLYEEDAMINTAKQIKAVNPDIAVFVWFDSVRIYTANKTLNPDLKPPCTTGHFRPADFLMTHREYLLMNSTHQPALEPWSGCYIYNFADATVRQFWTDMCLNMTKTGVIDGCGADASWQSDPANGTLTPAQLEAWHTGHRQMMKDTTAALKGGALLGKEPWELGDYVNAVLDEGCPPSNATIVTLQNLTRTAQREGRRLLYECHFEECKGYSCLNDSAAAFLIGAGPDHYFGLGGWTGTTGSSFASHWVPELFEPKLGAPTGPGQYDATTTVWTRRFAHASVTFNATGAKGKIEWGEGK